MFDNLIAKLENIKRIAKVKNEPVYRTSKLWLCDVRTLLKRVGRLSVASSEPNFVMCTTQDQFNYVDVLTGEEYPCADITRMVGTAGDKYVLHAKKLPKYIIQTTPFMTAEDIKTELAFENGFHTSTDYGYEQL